MQVNSPITDWLRRVSSTESPPASVIAFNIGLFETEGGYSACLTGADHFDPNDDDWACDEIFRPREHYLALPLDRDTVTWQQALVLVADAVREFVAAGEHANAFLAKAAAVTVGFDGGDLIRIK